MLQNIHSLGTYRRILNTADTTELCGNILSALEKTGLKTVWKHTHAKELLRTETYCFFKTVNDEGICYFKCLPFAILLLLSPFFCFWKDYFFFLHESVSHQTNTVIYFLVTVSNPFFCYLRNCFPVIEAHRKKF